MNSVTPKASPLKQLLDKANKFFNDTDHVFEPDTQFPPLKPPVDEEVGLRDNETDVYDGLMRAMAQAIDKKAKKDVATLYRFNRTRWVLTHVEIFVKSSFKDRQITLTRLAPKTLKKLFLSSLQKSPVGDMYNVADFSGVTLTLESDANTADFLQVLAVYEDDNVAYHFAFDGDIDTGEELAQDEDEALEEMGKPEPTKLPPSESGETPLSGNLQITLSSAGGIAFWPAGWGHPYANAEQVGVYHLPLVIGRTQQAANQGSGAGFGVQAMPASIATDKAAVFLPIYGCEQVSSEHVVISQNDADEVCMTDYSSNGTWLNGKRLAIGVLTPLPSTGELGLCAPSSLRSAKPSVQLQFALAGAQVAGVPIAVSTAAPLPTPAPAPVQESAPAVYVTAPVAPPAQAQGTQVGEVSPMVKGPARETQFSDEAATDKLPKPAAATAQLLVRTADGQIQTHAITHWPLTVGRESTCDIVLPENCLKASREHLRLERPVLRTTAAGTHSLRGFSVANLALVKNGTLNGTFNKGQSEDATFLLAAHTSGGRDGSSSQDGWITLGEAKFTAASVQIKLEALA